MLILLRIPNSLWLVIAREFYADKLSMGTCIEELVVVAAKDTFPNSER